MCADLTILSLGWGVQSWALAAMSALGVLPPIDVAIHADTTHERSETYAFAARWTTWLRDHGMTVLTVSDAGAAAKILDDSGTTHAPLFTVADDTGAHGQLRRSCTQRWKVAPQRRQISYELHVRGLKKSPGSVSQWFGITLDEVQRMSQSDVKYVAHGYPFIEMLDRPWTRGMVIDWLQRNNLEVPAKSACVFCPYHDRESWRQIKLSASGDFDNAVAIDAAIRHKRPGYLSYVCALRKPLAEIDFRNQEDHGQLSLWDEECAGLCFL